jgi:hypothetical protein
MDPNFRFDWLDTETKQLEWRTKLKDFLAFDQISPNRCELKSMSLLMVGINCQA